MSRAVTEMSEPILNIDYWSSLYPVYTEYDDSKQYERAMEKTSLVERAEELWGWKGLHRVIEFEEISPVLEDLDPDEYLRKEPQTAIEAVSDYLKDADIVNSDSLVTAAFLLHLMDSDKDKYSMKFPIYDRRVWNAFVYLWRIRDADESLYASASLSTAAYDRFCREFSKTCPDGRARDYERALFMFGGFIMKLPPKDSPTAIATIDEYLERHEEAIASNGSSEYALLDIDRVLDS